jgi:hypothetical protein
MTTASDSPLLPPLTRALSFVDDELILRMSSDGEMTASGAFLVGLLAPVIRRLVLRASARVSGVSGLEVALLAVAARRVG